jgi:hypothetical protein
MAAVVPLREYTSSDHISPNDRLCQRFFRRRGAIAGVTVGAILAVAILGLWFLIIARRNTRRRRERDNHSPTYRDQGHARSPMRRSMLMDDDEHAERAQNLRASPSYSNEKDINASRFALAREASYHDATSPSSDNQYEDGLGDDQMDSIPLNSHALSQFPSPPTSLKPRAGLRRRPKSVTSLKGVVFEMETDPSRQHSRSATHADTEFGNDPPSPTQASSSHGHSSSSHADTSSSSHGHSNDWSHSRSNISHGTSFTSVPSHTDTGKGKGKGKGKAPPPWTHGGVPFRPSSSGSGQGSSQGHSSQDHSTSSSLRPGSSGSHLSSSQGHESSFSSLSSPNTTSASTSEENIRSSKRRSRPRVQFNLQPPPLSRAEVAERKASITSSPSYSSDSLLIVPSTIGSYPQNFTPPSKTTLPQLRTITPSPPSSRRSNSPPSPANSDIGHGLDEIEEHEDRLYESRLDPRLDPRVAFDLKSEILPPPESEVVTPESFGPRDDEDYTRRLNIRPGVSYLSTASILCIFLTNQTQYFPGTPATRGEEVDDPMVAFSGASTIKTTTTTGH